MKTKYIYIIIFIIVTASAFFIYKTYKSNQEISNYKNLITLKNEEIILLKDSINYIHNRYILAEIIEPIVVTTYDSVKNKYKKEVYLTIRKITNKKFSLTIGELNPESMDLMNEQEEIKSDISQPFSKFIIEDLKQNILIEGCVKVYNNKSINAFMFSEKSHKWW